MITEPICLGLGLSLMPYSHCTKMGQVQGNETGIESMGSNISWRNVHNPAMTLVILFSLKTVESFENGLQTRSGGLYCFHWEQNCKCHSSVDADAWYKWALTDEISISMDFYFQFSRGDPMLVGPTQVALKNSLNSVKKVVKDKVVRTCNLLRKRPRCYHRASKTQR